MSGISIFNRILKNQAGFSLTEVMIGGSILAGVGLAGAMMFKDQKKAQKVIELDQKLATFHQALTKTISHAPNCNATMQSFFNQVISPTTSLPLYTCASNCESDDVSRFGTGAISVVRSAELFRDTPERYIDKSRTWRIERISLPLSSSMTTTGPLSLKVDYILDPKFGSKRKSRNIVLNVRFSEANFKECYSAQESSVNNLQNDICETLKAERVSSVHSDGRIAVWNDATQTCEINNNLKNCPPGSIIEGIRSDGRVTCKSTTSGLNINSLGDPVIAPCKTPVLKWDSGTKKMRLECP